MPKKITFGQKHERKHTFFLIFLQKDILITDFRSLFWTFLDFFGLFLTFGKIEKHERKRIFSKKTQKTLKKHSKNTRKTILGKKNTEENHTFLIQNKAFLRVF